MTQPLEGIRGARGRQLGVRAVGGRGARRLGRRRREGRAARTGRSAARAIFGTLELRRRRDGQLHARAVEPQQAVDRARPHHGRRAAPSSTSSIARQRRVPHQLPARRACASCGSPPTTCAGRSPTSCTRSRRARAPRDPTPGGRATTTCRRGPAPASASGSRPEGAPFIQQRAGIVDTTGRQLPRGRRSRPRSCARQRTGEAGRRRGVAARGRRLDHRARHHVRAQQRLRDAARPPRRTRRRSAVHVVRVRGRPPARLHDDATRAVLARGRARRSSSDALLADERFDTPEKRAAETDALCAVLAERIRTRPRDEWAARMNAADIIWGPVQSPDEFVDDVQVIANGYVLDMPRPDGSTITRHVEPRAVRRRTDRRAVGRARPRPAHRRGARGAGHGTPTASPRPGRPGTSPERSRRRGV